METIKDEWSGENFQQKRGNQKFATRANQIAFNNRIARNKRKAKAFVEKVLDKNRTALKMILANEKEITKSRDYLMGAGLNLNCSTHKMNRDGVLYTCIYEYAYTVIDTNYKIIKL